MSAREELVKAVGDAWDVEEACKVAYAVSRDASYAAETALIAYDKETQ